MPNYDYVLQCWVRPTGTGDSAIVQRCGHPTPLSGCYACANHGRVVPATPANKKLRAREALTARYHAKRTNPGAR